MFMQGDMISMKPAALQKVERYAIVGAPTWMEHIVATVSPAFPDIDMRSFSAARESEVWEWVGAKSAH